MHVYGQAKHRAYGRRRTVRSQSAMEYLMTYGWAILIIAVILAAFFELGVFNPYTFAAKAQLEKIAYSVAVKAVRLSKHAKRKTVEESDVKLAFQ